MKFLRESITVKTVILVVTMCCFLTVVNGCNIKEIYNKLFVYNGRWIKQKDPQTGVEHKIGCQLGGNECFFGGLDDAKS